MRLPIQTYTDRSAPAAGSRLINCYMESLPADARAPYLLRRCPGVTGQALAASNSTGELIKIAPLVGTFPSSGEKTLIAVTTTALSYLTLGTSTTSTSTIGTPVGRAARVDIASNQATTVIVIAPLAYYYNAGSFSQITDTDFTSRGAGDVEFLDQFLLFREPSSARFFRSDVGSATAYTSTNFATAEAATDRLVGMKSNQSQIVLLGETSLEMRDTTGGSGFGLRPVINGSVGVGCLSSASVAEIDNQVIWLADDKTVRILQGQTAQKISTPAIDQILEDEGALSNVSASTYSFDGHVYYTLYLYARTLVYDLTTGLWHERQSAGGNAWKWISAATMDGRVYLANGNFRTVGYLSNERFTEPDDQSFQPFVYENVPMQWTYMPTFGGGSRVFHNRLEIILETGVGLVGGNEPMISLEYSDDGGGTWQFAADRSIGNYGQRFQRVQWHGLGASYQRVYRATVTEPVPITVTDSILQASGV